VGPAAEVRRRWQAALAAAGLPSVLHSGLLDRWPEAQPPPLNTSTASVVMTAVSFPAESVAEQWYDMVADSGALLLMLSVVFVLPNRYRAKALLWAAGALGVAGLGMALIAYRVGVANVPGAAFAAVSYLVAAALLTLGSRPPRTGVAASQDQPPSD
jgi:hypothetical protein